MAALPIYNELEDDINTNTQLLKLEWDLNGSVENSMSVPNTDSTDTDTMECLGGHPYGLLSTTPPLVKFNALDAHNYNNIGGNGNYECGMDSDRLSLPPRTVTDSRIKKESGCFLMDKKEKMEEKMIIGGGNGGL